MNALVGDPVYQTLSQATSQDANVLKPAEEKLREWETQPGFYTSLCKIISNKDLEIAVRWLGCVCLKNGIERYYRRHAPNGISEDEKRIIREELVNCFDEPTDVIALQLAVIVAKIARLDWPREWPNLIEILINNIRSNENEIRRYRSLLILSHVIKTLSSKRLIGDKKLFSELTANIFPIMYDFWNFNVDAFLSTSLEQRKSLKYKCDLEMSLMSAKILLKLTVFGYNKPHTSSHVINFMATIFDRMKTLLQFRLSVRDFDDQYRQLIEKHTLTLIKVLSSVLDTHPYSYVDFIAITLQHSSFYCFTKEGHGLLFDMLLIRWLNLMKAILQCSEYKATKSQGGEMGNEIAKVKNAKDAFFTTAVAHDICYKLINDYFVLNERDLAFWDSDPEGYAAEQIGESWKYNLRPCVEGLFIAFLGHYKETLIPIIVTIIESSKSSPNPDDMAAILKKDAVYNMFGLSVFDLFDEIDFDKWFTEVLVPELHVKNPNYRILRRRIPWLMGRWNGVRLSADLRPQMYTELINLLETCEDMAVRLTVASTIKDVVDDFEFRGKVFLEHIPRCFQLLYALLEQSKECETKMQVLNVLSFIIERVGWEIAPFFDSLVNYLPMLWQHAEGHNMLRCAIASVLIQIVRGLGDQCVTLEKFVIPVLEYSIDMEKEGHVYLQEDGLHLFYAYLENLKTSDDIFSVYHYLLALIEKSTEHLKIALKISTALLLLSPDKYMQSHAHSAIQTFLEMLPDLKREGMVMIFEFFETCIKVRPYQSIELLQSFLRDSIAKITSIDDKPTVFSARLTIMARIILFSNELFAQVGVVDSTAQRLLPLLKFAEVVPKKMEERVGGVTYIYRLTFSSSVTIRSKLVETTGNGLNISADIMFTQFLDTWLSKIMIVWPLERRKLLGLALLNLLTAGSNIVITRFSMIVAAIVEILNDVLISEENSRTYFDSLLLNEDAASSTNSETEDDYKTEHENRVTELTMNDPVHRVDILWYFQTQLEVLQKQVGESNFQQLMGSVTEDTINQLKAYIKKS